MPTFVPLPASRRLAIPHAGDEDLLQPEARYSAALTDAWPSLASSSGSRAMARAPFLFYYDSTVEDGRQAVKGPARGMSRAGSGTGLQR